MADIVGSTGLLADYFIVVKAGKTYIGRKGHCTKGYDVLEPAYEAWVKYMVRQDGNFVIIRECTPLFGSWKLSRIEYDPTSDLVIACSDMSGREREEWAGAITACEELKKGIRVAESGLVLAPDAANDATKPFKIGGK